MDMITVDESKQIQLNILKAIRSICDENGLRYYLAYGTLLGAIRHRGFIPWDDDIDIAMPRSDYNKFLEIAKSDVFDLYSIETNKDYIYSFAKASDKSTIVKPDGIKCKAEVGVSVDIFPIDGAGQDMSEAVSKVNATAVLFGLSIGATWKKYIPGRTKSKKKNLMRFGCFVLGRFVNQRKVLEKFNRIVAQNSYEDAELVTVYSSDVRVKEIMPKSVYGAPIKVPFEDDYFNAPADYDTYLTKVYGNYMQPPPVEQRIPLHTANVFRKE